MFMNIMKIKVNVLLCTTLYEILDYLSGAYNMWWHIIGIEILLVNDFKFYNET